MNSEQKEQIYADYYKKVYGYVLGKVGNTETAADICSDVFLKVYEKIDTFDETRSSVSTWIFTIMRNTLTDYYRTRKVSSEIPEDLRADDSPENAYITKESLGALAAALEKLGERERDIVIFRYYYNMKLTEIADKIGVSYSYVKILHNKALSDMKKYL